MPKQKTKKHADGNEQPRKKHHDAADVDVRDFVTWSRTDASSACAFGSSFGSRGSGVGIFSLQNLFQVRIVGRDQRPLLQLR